MSATRTESPDFRALFEAVPGLYLVLDPGFRIVAVSDAYLAATMTERAAILGRGIFEVFPDNPADPTATGVTTLRGSLERVRDLRRSDTMAVQKYDVRRPEAEGGAFEERYWSPVNSPVLDGDGALRWIIHRVEDVTAYVRERQARLAGGLASLPPDSREPEIYLRAQQVQDANRELRMTAAQLEATVASRTVELQHTIERLQGTEEELRGSVEELEVIEEELRQQNVELLEANQAVRVSEERLRAAVKHLPLVLFTHDRDLRFTWISDPRHGLTVERILGATDLDVLPHEAAAEAMELKRQVIETGESLRRDLAIDFPAGRAYYDLTLEPLRNEAGAVTGLTGAAFDVTPQKLVEESLRRTLDELRALVQASPHAIVGLDAEGLVRSWYGGAEEMFGWRADEVVGKPLPNVPRELGGEHRALRQRSIEGGRITGYETTRQRKDGSWVAVSLSCAPLHDAEGNAVGLVVVYTDISERRRAEEEGRARENAEAASRAKSQFLANMSHELRTPLNAIIGFSELLEDQASGVLTERQLRYVNNILTSGRHLLDLVNDILDLAKIEAGRLMLDSTSFAPVGAIREVQRIGEGLAVAKQLSLRVDLPADLPELTADRAKFKQILYNLLSNAIKFTPPGGEVSLTARLLPGGESEADHPWLELEVRDTGIGIRPEDQERIFLEFEQVDTSYGREQPGTGLGLALTRRLVELHGGRVGVRSDVGVGSTFTVLLPQAPRRSPLASPPAGVTAESGVGPTVLVVEDDPVAGDLLAHYLIAHGYSVARAASASEALDAARRLQPVAITLDILLPDQDGLEVLSRLRALAETERIPVIVVSVTDDRERGFSLGASEWLVKPVNRERFLNAVRLAIPGRPNEPGRTVLVIDDHREAVDLLAETLERRGYCALRAYGGRDGLRVATQLLPDIIILDLMMPDVNGFEVARRLQEEEATRRIPILVFTYKELDQRDRESLPAQVERVVSKSETSELLDALDQLPGARDREAAS